MNANFPTVFLTWTTYGTWLPGDVRGWVSRKNHAIQEENSGINLSNRKLMNQEAVRLSKHQRRLCDQTIREHCDLRKWNLLALNVRTNHIHIVVQANTSGQNVMRQFKSWCTRKLNENYEQKERWWTRSGWVRYLEEDEAIENAITYTLESQ